MAASKCPECGGLVSSTLTSCPHCGFVMEKVVTPSCDDLLNLAVKAHQEERDEDVVSYIDRILEINPMHYAAWAFKGNTIAWNVTHVTVEDAKKAAYTAWENALKYVPSSDVLNDIAEVISKSLATSFEKAQKHFFSILKTGHFSTDDFVLTMFCLETYIGFYNEANRRLDISYRTLTDKKQSPFTNGIQEKCSVSLWTSMVSSLAAVANSDVLKAKGLSEMPYSLAAAGLFLQDLEKYIDKFLSKEDRITAYRNLSSCMTSHKISVEMAGFNGRPFFDIARRMERRAEQVRESIKDEEAFEAKVAQEKAAVAAQKAKEKAEHEKRHRLENNIAIYWKEHPEEREAISKTLKEKHQEIISLQAQLSKLPEKEAVEKLELSYSGLIEKRNQLSILKKREIRAVEAEMESTEEGIDAAKSRLVFARNAIISQINIKKNEIAKLQKKLSNPLVSPDELNRVKATDLVPVETVPDSIAAQRKKERQSKKKTRVLIVILCVICLMVAGILIYSRVIVPDRLYNAAIEQSEQEEYQQAIDGFTALGEYKDSANMILEIQYKWAEAMLADKSYDEAYNKFEEIQDHSDAATRMNDVRYVQAEDYLETGRFEEAVELFEGLDDFSDAETRVKETYYLWAEAYLAEEKLEEALEHFAAAGNFNDAKSRAEEVYEMMQIHATAVKLNKTSLSISKGKTAELSVTMEPVDTTDTIVSWTSSDTSVATVDENGVVTAVDYGTATIEVKTSNVLTATCKVTVPKPQATATTSKVEQKKQEQPTLDLNGYFYKEVVIGNSITVYPRAVGLVDNRALSMWYTTENGRVSCVWGKMDGTCIPLTITAKEGGLCRVTIDLYVNGIKCDTNYYTINVVHLANYDD